MRCFVNKFNQLFKETVLASGGTFGPATLPQHGGDIGNSDFYAPGDNRMIWGTYKKGKDKKKKKHIKFPLYRRRFAELMNVESFENEINNKTFNCIVKTPYSNICCDILDSCNITYVNQGDIVVFNEKYDILKIVTTKIQNILTEDADIKIGNYSVLKYFKKPKKARDDYNQEQLKIGMEIEKEHTDDESLQFNIAANHLDENENYYKELVKMERKF